MPNNPQQFNQLVSFIWNIANDVLVQVFNKGDYKKVILPMMYFAVWISLEPTKEAVLKKKKQLDRWELPFNLRIDDHNEISFLQHLKIHNENANLGNKSHAFENEFPGVFGWLQQRCAGYYRKIQTETTGR